MCWGPYVLMCIYACFQNVKVISPKLRMVSQLNPQKVTAGPNGGSDKTHTPVALSSSLEVLPVVAKTNPIFNALLYSFGNEYYRGGLWYFLTGQKIAEPDPKKAKSK